MQILKITTLSIIVYAMIIGSSQAATDYNSSRSNKADTVTAPNVTNELLRKAQQDASMVSKSMIEVDQRDGYTGDYDITVDVRVTIKRSPPPSHGKIIIKEVGERR